LGLLNSYIIGSDDVIDINDEGVDSALWYFEAPTKSLGNYGIAYGGTLRFTLSSFAGDFSANSSSLNTSNYLINVIELECTSCFGPINKGIRLGLPVTSLSTTFTGTALVVEVILLESAGWLKDSQNSLLQWMPASQCDIIQVLSALTSLRILGDWTPWYETIALDNVMISNSKGKINTSSFTRKTFS
jgi:hypothetical protein